MKPNKRHFSWTFTDKKNKFNSNKKQSESKKQRIYYKLYHQWSSFSVKRRTYMGWNLCTSIRFKFPKRAMFLYRFLKFVKMACQWNQRVSSFLWWRCFPHCCKNYHSILTKLRSIKITLVPLLGGFHMAICQNITDFISSVKETFQWALTCYDNIKWESSRNFLKIGNV